MQGPPCPTQGCLYELHLHSRASLAPTETQSCVTLTNRTGFLCHDRRHCIPAHGVCDGIRTCPHGEDEDESLCREYPSVSSPVHPPQPLFSAHSPVELSWYPGLDKTSRCTLRDPSPSSPSSASAAILQGRVHKLPLPGSLP